MELNIQLDSLIDCSSWNKYSNIDNVINMSSTRLSKYQTKLLGCGLNFSLPHEKNHLLDFVEQLDNTKSLTTGSTDRILEYNFIRS